MRIAYVGPVPPHRGGIAQHGWQTIRAFERLGHDVAVESWQSLYPKRLFSGEQPAGLPDRDGNVCFGLRWWSPLSWLRAGRRCRGVDLIVFPWVTPVHAISLWTLLWSADRPAVSVVHNPVPHERMPLSQALLRAVMRRTNGAVVHAESAAVELRVVTDVGRVEVTPHPPNLAIEATPLRYSSPLRVLFLGFVRLYKGVDLAIDAIDELCSRGVDVRLTVAGDFWEDPDSIQQDLVTRRLSDRVALRVGYVPDEEIGPILAEHQVVLAPYRSATVSGVVPLAFAAGRPVVVTPVGGLPEAVTNGENGIVADAVDARALADAVVAAANDLERLGDGAAKSATHWEDVADALLRVAH